MVSNDSGAHKDQVRATFDLLADGDYDAAGPGCFAYFGQRLVEEVGIEPGQHVLDVASGRGAVLYPAAERVGPKGTIEGIDISEGMVLATTEEAMRRGIAARVSVMDAEHLDFPEGAFDRVLCGFGVMFFPDQEKSLSEFWRVLKPGGRIGLSTWQVSQAEELVAVLNDLKMRMGEPNPGWITDPHELSQLLIQAGFSELHVMADAKAFRYNDLEQYWQNARGTGLRRRLDALTTEETECVHAALAERVGPHQRSDGIYLEATALLAIATRDQH